MTFKEQLLGNLLTFQRGYDITKAEQTEGEVPIVSSSGVSSFHNEAKATAPGVVIGRKGTLGTVHYLDRAYWPHDTTLWVKDFKGSHPRFLSYFLATLRLENFDTGASNPTLNRNHLHKIKVIAPGAKEQEKIAAVLGAYDDLIANNQRRIALLESMAEEIYREWFVRMRFPEASAVERAKGIPSGWRVCSMADLFITSSGGTPSRSNPANFSGTIPWVKTGELKGTFISATEECISEIGLESSAAKLLPARTVVMAMYCAMPDVAILDVDAATNQACCALTPRSNRLGVTWSYFFASNALRQMVNFAHGAAQQNLSQEIIRRFKVLAPDEPLIERFGAIADPLFEQVSVLYRQNALLRSARDALLPRLISGKLRVEASDIQFPPSMQPPPAEAAQREALAS